MVSDLAEQGVLERREDEADRRRAVITIAAANKSAVEDWLANGAAAWRLAFEPLTPAERETFLATLRTYDQAMAAARKKADPPHPRMTSGPAGRPRVEAVPGLCGRRRGPTPSCTGGSVGAEVPRGCRSGSVRGAGD